MCFRQSCLNCFEYRVCVNGQIDVVGNCRIDVVGNWGPLAADLWCQRNLQRNPEGCDEGMLLAVVFPTSVVRGAAAGGHGALG